MKIIGENIGKTLEQRRIFQQHPKIKETKSKNEQMGIYQTKNLLQNKENNRVKRQPVG